MNSRSSSVAPVVDVGPKQEDMRQRSMSLFPADSVADLEANPRCEQWKRELRRKTNHPMVFKYWRLRWAAEWPLRWRPLARVTSLTIGEMLVLGCIAAGLCAMCWVYYTDARDYYRGGGAVQGDAEESGEDDIPGGESAGSLSSLLLGVAIALTSRNSLWNALLGIPFERALSYHIAAAVASVLVGAEHMIIFIWEDAKWSGDRTTGYLLLGLMGLICVMSMGVIRRRLFEVFYRCHWLLFLSIFVMATLHPGGSHVIGLVFWGVDIVLRFLMVQLKNPRVASLSALPSDVVRITFNKRDLDYEPGQYVFVCIPELSPWEWHPFSMSSCPEDAFACIHVRVLGDWTRRLHELVAKDAFRRVEIGIEGPYGTPMVDIHAYSLFLLVSGGIGITPLQSTANHLLHRVRAGKQKITHMRFVWSVRDRWIIDALHDRKPPAKHQPLTRLPLSFSPDTLLMHGSSRNVLEEGTDTEMLVSQFHLTRHRNKEEFDAANINPDVQDCLHFGRPDLKAIFQELKAIAVQHGESRVAVMCCGPDAMMKDAMRLCSSMSTPCGSCSSVHFDWHGETFDF